MKSLKVKPKTVSEFQKYLKDLYGEANNTRDFEYVFSYLFRNASYLSRAMPRNNDCVQNFVKTISWLLTLSNKLEVDVCEAYLKKYPLVCPYCVAGPCVCAKTNKQPPAYMKGWVIQEELKKKYGVIKVNNMEFSLNSLAEKTNDLYPANVHIWRAAGPTFHFFRLFEELGEVHEAYTSFCRGIKSKSEIEDELADCFAWILSAWSIYYIGENLDDAFITYYYNDCPVCSCMPCKCKDYSDRGEMLVKIEELREFRAKVSELLDVAPAHNEIIKSVIEDLDFAEKSGKTAVAVSAVKQSETVLEKIASQLDHVDNSSKSVKSIVLSAIAIGKSFNWLS